MRGTTCDVDIEPWPRILETDCPTKNFVRYYRDHQVNGRSMRLEEVFQIIPREHEDPIDDKSAEDILRAAIDIAVYKRLSQIDS